MDHSPSNAVLGRTRVPTEGCGTSAQRKQSVAPGKRRRPFYRHTSSRGPSPSKPDRRRLDCHHAQAKAAVTRCTRKADAKELGPGTTRSLRAWGMERGAWSVERGFGSWKLEARSSGSGFGEPPKPTAQRRRASAAHCRSGKGQAARAPVAMSELRTTNPRYGRLPACATGRWASGRPWSPAALLLNCAALEPFGFVAGFGFRASDLAAAT
jgi:hypothetical protein